MKRRVLIGLLLLGVVLPLTGQVRQEGQTLLFQPVDNRTQAQVGFRMREEDDAYLPAEGKGLMQGEFRAHSRHRLDSIHRVEGRVSYERGVKRAVNWNTSSDWDILAPYITLDTVGGDLQKEQYRFAARFASRPGRFFYSIWADYRALHEYRNVDPRPRNITADLQVSALGGLQMGAYALSLEAGYRRYHQSEDVEFMDPKGNNTSVLHYLGFGRYSTRFSGAKKNTAVRFNGNGFNARLVLEPVNGLGWMGGASYTWLQLVRHLPGNNETPMSKLLNQEMHLYGGHKWSQAYIRADAQLRVKIGTENIVDQTSAFNVLSGLDMLQVLSWKASVSGFRSWEGERATWTLLPRLAYSGSSWQNVQPGAGMAFHYAQASATGRAAFRAGAWKFRVEGEAGVRLCVTSSRNLEKLSLDSRFQTYFDHLYGRWSDHTVHGGLKAAVGRKVARDLFLYARPEAAYRHALKEGHHRWDVLVAIGLEF